MRTLMFLTMMVSLPDRPDLTPRQNTLTPQAMILGDWRLEALEFPKQGPKYAVPQNCVFRISATDTVFIVNGKPSEADGLTATYKIDFSTNPAVIDLMPKQRGGVMPGILRMEGNRLILALTTGGTERPLNFTSAQMIAYYTRIQN